MSPSRGLTYSFGDENVTKELFVKCVREKTLRMRDDIATAVKGSVTCI